MKLHRNSSCIPNGETNLAELASEQRGYASNLRPKTRTWAVQWHVSSFGKQCVGNNARTLMNALRWQDKASQGPKPRIIKVSTSLKYHISIRIDNKINRSFSPSIQESRPQGKSDRMQQESFALSRSYGIKNTCGWILQHLTAYLVQSKRHFLMNQCYITRHGMTALLSKSSLTAPDSWRSEVSMPSSLYLEARDHWHLQNRRSNLCRKPDHILSSSVAGQGGRRTVQVQRGANVSWPDLSKHIAPLLP